MGSYILKCSWSRCAPNLLKWPTAIGDQSRYNHAGFEDPVSTVVCPDSVWTCPDTVWTEPPNLLKWGLTGRGSNVLKSRRPLTPTTSGCSRARTPATRARFLRCRAALGRSASRPRRHSGPARRTSRVRENCSIYEHGKNEPNHTSLFKYQEALFSAEERKVRPAAGSLVQTRDGAPPLHPRAPQITLVISTPSGAAAASVTVGQELLGPAGRSSIGRTDEG